MLLYIILLIIVLLLIIILSSKIGVGIQYEKELLFSIHILGIKFPLDFKKNEKKENKTEKNGENTTDIKKVLDDIGSIGGFIKVVYKKLFKKAVCQKLNLTLVISDDDPYDASILYGTANTVIYNLAGFIDRMITIKKRKIDIGVDFEGNKFFFKLDILLTARIYKVLAGYISFFFDNLKDTSKSSKNNKGGVENG